ncbi:MAG: CRISPR-associated endonuclease Cas3'', partial [Atopobiaceae bacterium]|nr:CRISPR-associated endonuclease Cas3'' [Atopobiaceae bacterium]
MASDNANSDLSSQAGSLWGKTGGRENPSLWNPLVTHLADTAEVVRLIWREWLAISVQSFVCQQIQLSSQDAEVLVTWIACVHDIGKASPSFQSKVSDRSEVAASTGLRFSSHCESYSHASMGELMLKRWLVERGWNERLCYGCAAIVGGHHGINPNEEDLEKIAHRTRVDPLSSLGDEEWSNVQDELLMWAFVNTGASAAEKRLREATLPTRVQVILTATVILAEWSASNT